MMNSDVSTDTRIAEDLPVESAAARPASMNIPGIMQLSVKAEVEDVLALLRTAVILARHFGVSLVVDLPEAVAGRTASTNSRTEMHLGSAQCSAMLSALLHSVEQRLRMLRPDLENAILVEFGFLVESRGFFLRICSAGPLRQSQSHRRAPAAENSTVSKSGLSK